MNTTYGQRLAELRIRKKFTQQELAKAAGVPFSTLRSHEYGTRTFTVADLFAYSKALGVKCSAFDDCVASKSARKPNPAARLKRKPKSQT